MSDDETDDEMADDELADDEVIDGHLAGAARILVVDDEPNIVVSLEFLLGQEGYEVSIARDGEEALRRAEDERPDLVLLDVMLPGLDGFEVCRRLQAMDPPPKVVLLTARGRSAERLRGLDLGADLYVTKPFSTRDLMVDLRKVLAGEAPGDSENGSA